MLVPCSGPTRFAARLHPALPDVRPDVEAWCAQEGVARPSDAMIADYYLPMAAWIVEHVDDAMITLGLAGARRVPVNQPLRGYSRC